MNCTNLNFFTDLLTVEKVSFLIFRYVGRIKICVFANYEKLFRQAIFMLNCNLLPLELNVDLCRLSLL